MRVLTVFLISAFVGTAVGAGVAYVQVGIEAETPLLDTGDKQSGSVADVRLQGHPEVHIDELEHDFGKMQRGTSESHTFVISNVGQAPLRLQLGKPSCKCTVGTLPRNVLKPGESVDLVMEWKAQSAEGPFRQWVPLTTNDPRRSRLELSVEGEVTRPTGLIPPDFAIDKIPYGESKSAQVYLTAFTQDDVQVKRAEIVDEKAREHFDVKIEDDIPVDELPEGATAGVRITVTAKPTLPIGRFIQWLALDTNLPDAPELEVPIEGRVVGDISIYGVGWNEEQGVLRLGRVLSAKGKQAKLNIVVRGEHARDVEFKVGATNPPELAASLGEPRRLKDELLHVPMVIEVPEGTRPMARLNTDHYDPATVTLKTNHPQAPELVINVRFAVER